MTSRRLRLGTRTAALTLVSASLAVFLAVAEAVLRLGGVAAAPDVGVLRLADPRFRIVLDCYPTNPRGYFEIDLRTKAGQVRYRGVAPHRFERVRGRNPWAVETRFSSVRFRNPEVGPRDPGVTRVALVGDSFTEGQGVKESDTTARVLARRLEAKAPGRFEVVNCGRRAQDFPGLLQVFGDALALEPDVVVYAMVLNDVERSEAFQARQRYVDDWILAREEGWDEKGAQEAGLDLRLFTFVKRRLDAARIGRASTDWYLGMVGKDNAPGWSRTKEHLREMARRTKERGARFLLMLWPLFVDLDGAYPFQPVHDAVRRACLEAGIEQLDLLDAFRGRASDTLWVHAVDRHPNEVAHARAADALAPLLAGSLTLSAR
jgi:hypothetical protein